VVAPEGFGESGFSEVSVEGGGPADAGGSGGFGGSLELPQAPEGEVLPKVEEFGRAVQGAAMRKG
jgi:hypothetical protein